MKLNEWTPMRTAKAMGMRISKKKLETLLKSRGTKPMDIARSAMGLDRTSNPKKPAIIVTPKRVCKRFMSKACANCKRECPLASLRKSIFDGSARLYITGSLAYIFKLPGKQLIPPNASRNPKRAISAATKLKSKIAKGGR